MKLVKAIALDLAFGVCGIGALQWVMGMLETMLPAANQDHEAMRAMLYASYIVVMGTAANVLVKLILALRRTNSGPMPIVRLVIDITTPRQEADALLGDLEEGFKKRARKQGRAYAHTWYTSQVIRSAGPLLWAAAKRLIGITAVSEFLKRIG